MRVEHSVHCSGSEDEDSEAIFLSPTKGDASRASASIPEPRLPLHSPNKRYRCKDPEILVPTSPRIFGKQTIERVVTMKRNANLCQREECFFSIGQPGQPARAARPGIYCIWCDPQTMKTRLETKAGKDGIAKSMTRFKPHPNIYIAAMDLLPEDFYGDTHYCKATDCVFNTNRPGSPARCNQDGGHLCLWCDPDVMSRLCNSRDGAAKVKHQLTIFQSTNPELHIRALALVPASISCNNTDPHDDYCVEPGCAFNARRPGHPARRAYSDGSRASVYCMWHDADLLESYLQTIPGRCHVRTFFNRFKKSCEVHDTGHLFHDLLMYVPDDFQPASRFCDDPSCCFSITNVGRVARAQPGSHLCAWCDPAALSAREKHAQGPGQIAYALCQWTSNLDVFLAAWLKLSPDVRLKASLRASPHWEQTSMSRHDFVRQPDTGRHLQCPWRLSAWEQQCMERHDFLIHPHRRGLDNRYENRVFGMSCALCGVTYLRRTKISISLHALQSGIVDDPISSDRICAATVASSLAGARASESLELLRPGIRCTLCWEARCTRCSAMLSLADHLWRQTCVHCDQDLVVDFAQRPARRPTWITDAGTGMSLDEIAAMNYSTAAVAYEHDVKNYCTCCGERAGSQYRYLTWQPAESADFAVPFWRQQHYLVTRDFQRPGFLCRRCLNQQGCVQLERNLCPWSTSDFAWHTLGRSYFWQCACRGGYH